MKKLGRNRQKITIVLGEMSLAIMIDTGVFYSFFDKKDEYYLDSVAILTHCLEGRFGQPFTSDYVILEATILLQKRLSVDASVPFLDFVRDNKITTMMINEETYEHALRLFRKEFKRLSLCDSATVICMNELSITSLATFDLRSFFGLVGRMYGEKYFASLSDKDQGNIRKILQ